MVKKRTCGGIRKNVLSRKISLQPYLNCGQQSGHEEVSHHAGTKVNSAPMWADDGPLFPSTSWRQIDAITETSSSNHISSFQM